jgi:hypothetical protein
VARTTVWAAATTGAKWSRPARISSPALGDCGQQVTARGHGDGALLAAFVCKKGRSTRMYTVTRPAGARVWTAPKLLGTYRGTTLPAVQVALNDRGDAAAVWNQDRRMEMAFSSDGGKSWSAPQDISGQSRTGDSTIRLLTQNVLTVSGTGESATLVGRTESVIENYRPLSRSGLLAVSRTAGVFDPPETLEGDAESLSESCGPGCGLPAFRIASDDAGDFVAAWLGQDGLRTSFRLAGGVWSPSTLVAAHPQPDLNRKIDTFDLAVSATGRAALAWQESAAYDRAEGLAGDMRVALGTVAGGWGPVRPLKHVSNLKWIFARANGPRSTGLTATVDAAGATTVGFGYCPKLDERGFRGCSVRGSTVAP